MIKISVGVPFAAGAKGAGKEFSHWIPNRMSGPRLKWNGNFVTPAQHYYHNPHRYPRGWRDSGSKYPAWLQQLDRVPYGYKGAAAGIAVGTGGAAMNGCANDEWINSELGGGLVESPVRRQKSYCLMNDWCLMHGKAHRKRKAGAFLMHSLLLFRLYSIRPEVQKCASSTGKMVGCRCLNWIGQRAAETASVPEKAEGVSMASSKVARAVGPLTCSVLIPRQAM